MTAFLVLAFSIVVLGVVVAAISRILSGKGNADVVHTADDCASCGGHREKCEQECMVEAAINPIEYFDDEELDRYANRPSDSYSDDEAEEFRDVLYTMKQEEVADWNRSLALRGINIPDQVKDELLLLIAG